MDPQYNYNLIKGGKIKLVAHSYNPSYLGG
jgi:hypothetical protein